MSTPTAEVMISPEVSRQALRDMAKSFDKAFDKVAKDAEKDIEKAIANGAKKGAKKGGRSLGGMFRAGGRGIMRGFDSLGGVKAMGGGIAALGLAGFTGVMNRADAGTDQIASLLHENLAQNKVNFARANDFDLPQFSQLLLNMQQFGGVMNEQDSIDMMRDINDRLGDARSGGMPLLNNFTQYSGMDAINRVLASIGSLDNDMRDFRLAELGFSGEAGDQITSLLAQVRYNDDGSVRSGGEIRKALEELNKSEGQKEAERLKQEAELAQKFREESLKIQRDYVKRALDMAENGGLDAYFKEQKRVVSQQLTILGNYEENQEAATAARAALDDTMNALNTGTQDLINQVKRIANWIDNQTDGGTKSVTEVAIDNILNTPTEPVRSATIRAAQRNQNRADEQPSDTPVKHNNRSR